MVNATPFEKLLAEATEQARTGPAGVFVRLDELYGKSQSDRDVLKLATFAAQLGGAGLGRFEDTIAFLERLLTHPALEANGHTWRSIHRAMAVLHTCLGQADQAKLCVQKGITSDDERCRYAIMTAQTLIARGRSGEATAALADAAQLVGRSRDGELVGQVGVLGLQALRQIEREAGRLREAALAAGAVVRVAFGKSDQWRDRHKAIYHLAGAQIVGGYPALALRSVQELMKIEDQHQAGPVERFFTTALAVRAQLARNQVRVASQALEAARDYAGRVAAGQEADQVQHALRELEHDYDLTTKAVGG